MAGGRDVKEVCVSRQLGRAPRPCGRPGARALLLAALVLLVLGFSRPGCAQAVKGEISTVVENGFARLVFTLAAAERLYVDLLPDTWTGLPPGLPREVIDELARRAREAEKKVRAQRVLARQTKLTPIRVRVASQPTFTRYVFDLPELIGVAANNGK